MSDLHSTLKELQRNGDVLMAIAQLRIGSAHSGPIPCRTSLPAAAPDRGATKQNSLNPLSGSPVSSNGGAVRW